MKTLRILLFAAVSLIVGCPQVYSQLRYFLPDSNAYFSVSPYKFWFQGDTAIESKVYKKVYLQQNDSLADFTRATYYAAVREDTLEERIYCFRTDDESERLLADFSLEEGDTVTVFTYWGYEQINLTVNSIDSILINGNYRKRINFEHDWPSSEENHESWIEGIGSTYGIFFPAAIFYSLEIDYPILLCVQINEELIYDNPEFENCYLNFCVGIDENQQTNFDIYPNPSNDKFYISCDNFISNQSLTYQVINLQGVILLHGELANTTEIEVSGLLTGIYIVYLKNRNRQTIFSMRFIKY